MRLVAAIVISLTVYGCGTVSGGTGDVAVLKARILARDPEARQPKYECPAEMICLRYPNSYTVDVREVLSGGHLPRRMHVILWVHTEPPEDLLIAGTRLASGDVESNDWTLFEYAGCVSDEPEPQNAITEKLKALRLAGRLPCKKES